MFRENLAVLRKLTQMSQEAVAEKLGISRQAYASYEKGDTLPDIEKCVELAKLFNVSLDDLVNYKNEEHILPMPPNGKHIFGAVTVGEKGQIVIPKQAREIFGISTGDKLIVLGDEDQGIAIIKEQQLLEMANAFSRLVGKGKEDGKR